MPLPDEVRIVVLVHSTAPRAAGTGTSAAVSDAVSGSLLSGRAAGLDMLRDDEQEAGR